MVMLSHPEFKHLPAPKTSTLYSCFAPEIPVVDLTSPHSKHEIVTACKEFGFFQLINHNAPMELIDSFERDALQFFSLPQSVKDQAAQAKPFGYGTKKIGPNGDEGLVEYLLLRSDSSHPQYESISNFSQASVNDYVTEAKKLCSTVLELIADGLQIAEKDLLSRLVTDGRSDSALRINHYPLCNQKELQGRNEVIGFGEHTDPQIISVLRSNNAAGLQIALRDGTWISVPPDHDSFFFFVGDSMEVLTNRRFRSVKHRVMSNSHTERLSVVYFAGPPLDTTVAPIPSLLEPGEESLYREFTWREYKAAAYATRLEDNRLAKFQR